MALPSHHLEAYQATHLAMVRLFAEVLPRPWGYLIHNAANPGHWEANTAHWQRADDPDAAIREIIDGYRRLDVAPRVRLTDESQPGDARERLIAQGFRCESTVNTVMRWAPGGPAPLEADPESLLIERATPANAETIAAILLAANEWGDDPGWAVHYVRALARSQQASLYLARLDGQPAAFAGIVRGEEAGLVFDVATHPDFRRRGAASALMGRALSEAPIPLYLEVNNPAARRIYERVGFSVVGEVREVECVLE